MLEVHNVAPFRIVREAAPYLRAKKPEDIAKNKSIVNVSSVAGTLILCISVSRACETDSLDTLQVSMAMCNALYLPMNQPDSKLTLHRASVVKRTMRQRRQELLG